jgi:hypothetical protein
VKAKRFPDKVRGNDAEPLPSRAAQCEGQVVAPALDLSRCSHRSDPSSIAFSFLSTNKIAVIRPRDWSIVNFPHRRFGSACLFPTADSLAQVLRIQLSRDGTRLAYVRNTSVSGNIWKFQEGAPPAKWSSSTRPEADPQLSPDGKRVAFSIPGFFYCKSQDSCEIQCCVGAGPDGITRWENNAVHRQYRREQRPEAGGKFPLISKPISHC